MKKAKIILLWIIGSMFIITGSLKLVHLDKMSEAMFSRANYPSWLLYVVAATELLGGILILIKSARLAGLGMVSIIMLGAIITHMYLKDDYVHLLAPVVILLFSAWVAKDSKHKQTEVNY